MTRALPLASMLLALWTPTLAAQDHHDHGAAPYAGLQDRTIKALSADEIDGLLAGEGLGFALAAELNGLPGPKHVLEMAADLDLTPEQSESVQRVFAEMQAEAIRLGELLVEGERHLDMMFAQRHASPELVRGRTEEVAATRGRLRAAHLVAHLATEALLTPEQVARYAAIRGYAPAG